MNEFAKRQITLAHAQFDDFRRGAIGLDTLLRRVEGLARALSDEFWAERIFSYALELEQINASAIEDRRDLTSAEHAQVEEIVEKMELCFVEFE